MNHCANRTLIISCTMELVTEHKLFLVQRITPKSRAKVCAQWRMSLSPHPGSLLATDRSKAVVLV